MSSAFGPLSVVANPSAGRRSARRLGAVRRALDERGFEYRLLPTQAPGDATRLAREAVEGGGRFVVAVGGDGTVHEVVKGLLDSGGRAVAAGAVLGVVSAGSGCDLVRTFDLPAEPAAAVGRLAGESVRTIDVARISFVDAGGGRASRYFANIAEAGLGAATAGRALRMPRSLGQSRYLAAFWAVLPKYRVGDVRIEVDGRAAYEGRGVNVVVANGRYFGGGMHISPRSDPCDGQLDVLVFHGRKTDSFTMMPKVFRGTHLPHRHVAELKGTAVTIDAERPMLVEADGEVLGTTPVSVEVVPGAVTLKV